MNGNGRWGMQGWWEFEPLMKDHGGFFYPLMKAD
jgi:hypothetical protein